MPVSTEIRVVLDSIDSPRLLLRSDYTVAFANQAFVKRYGRNDYLGRHCYELLFQRTKPCAASGFPCPLDESVATLKPCKYLRHESGPTGTTYWDLETTPMLANDGTAQYFVSSISRRTGDLTPLTLKGIVSRSKSIQNLLKQISKITTLELPVLLLGSPGVGKGEFARLIHENSRRASHDFVTIECEGLTPERLSQELQYNSTEMMSRGGGTLYLSDIALLSKEMQSTLLKILNTGMWTIKTDDHEGKVYADLRVVCGSESSLAELANNPNLRKDFFLRFSVCPLVVPGLDKRKEDIPELVDIILEDIKSRGMNIGISSTAIDFLQNKVNWEGHVTELQTLILRAAIFCESLKIRAQDLMIEDTRPESVNDEDARLRELLKSWEGSKADLATRLGISLRTLYRRIEHLEKPEDEEGTAEPSGPTAASASL